MGFIKLSYRSRLHPYFMIPLNVHCIFKKDLELIGLVKLLGFMDGNLFFKLRIFYQSIKMPIKMMVVTPDTDCLDCINKFAV